MMANSREFLGLAVNLLTSHAVNRNIYLSIIGYNTTTGYPRALRLQFTNTNTGTLNTIFDQFRSSRL